MVLKVLSYNIHKGRSLNRQFVLESMKTAIQSVESDLVFLQEVMGSDTKKEAEVFNNQLEYLADSLWTHYAYGQNAITSEGHYGNAILSKIPIIHSSNLNISTNSFEKRGLLFAQIACPKSSHPPVYLICVHLDLLQKGRNKQLSRIIQWIQSHCQPEFPLILAGDFNDWRKRSTPVLRQNLGLTDVAESTLGERAKTFPSWLPILPLDRIYVRGFKARSLEILKGEPWRTLSDHCALLTHLEIDPNWINRLNRIPANPMEK